MIEALSFAAVFPLGMTLWNLLTWKRLAPSDRELGVSILIPARNEGQRIRGTLEAALRAASAQPGPIIREILVYDDDSEDDTAHVVSEVSARDPRVKLLRGDKLPPGWVGKPHACQKLFEAASSEALLFIDAEVKLEPFGVARLLAWLTRPDPIAVVSAVPRQRTVTFAERAVVSLLLLTYLAWLPLILVEKSSDPRLVAANGQLLMIRRDTCQNLGGFVGVRAEIVDDVAYLKMAKRSGLKVAFVDGTEVAECRMYSGPREVWRGFSKNIASGLGGTWGAVFLATNLYLICFVLPYLTLIYGLVEGAPEYAHAGAVGVVANLALRSLLAFRFRQPKEQVLVHPFGVLALIAIAWNSWSWHSKKRIVWAGRTYKGGAT